MIESLGLISLFMAILFGSFRWIEKQPLSIHRLKQKLQRKPTETLIRSLERAGLPRESASWHQLEPFFYAGMGLFSGLLLFFIGLPIYLPLSLGLIGFLWPQAKLKKEIQKRQRSILSNLPYYLDLMTLALEAGLDLIASIEEILRHDPPHPLRDEMLRLVHSIQMGTTRSDAFVYLSERTGLQPLTLLASSVVQSEELGASLGSLFRLQSESLRKELYRQAEEEAQRAPMKLLIPLIGLIFPVLFLLLFAPLAIRFFL